jgi:hypothetical protein
MTSLWLQALQKWLNITAIIQDDNLKLHSLVKVMKR